GAAVVLAHSERDGRRLAREVGGLLAAPQRMAEMSNAARVVAKPDAAERVADELLALVGEKDARWGGRSGRPLASVPPLLVVWQHFLEAPPPRVGARCRLIPSMRRSPGGRFTSW